MTSPNCSSRRRFFSSSAMALLALGTLPRLARAEAGAEPRRPLLTDPATREGAAAKRVAPKPGATPANPPAARHQPAAPAHPVAPHAAPASAGDLWADLMAGNKRFVAGRPQARMLVPTREELAHGQHPRVIVLACSDSRVSPTLIFDKTLGDLFVIRTAGNVADPVAIGSIEYAAEHLHSSLLVVMGHDKCGAVSAAVEGGKMPSPNLDAIVRKITPVVDKLRFCGSAETVLGLAVEANVRQSARTLLENSAILREELGAGKLALVRAVYRLKSGEVDRLSDD